MSDGVITGIVSATNSLSGAISGVETVTGVKGAQELTYRQGNVNLTAANIGAAPDNDPRLLNLTANLSANSTHVYSVASGHRGLMVIQRGSLTDGGLYFVTSALNGSVYIAPIKEANNVTVTTGVNEFTLENTSSSNYYVSFIGNNSIT